MEKFTGCKMPGSIFLRGFYLQDWFSATLQSMRDAIGSFQSSKTFYMPHSTRNCDLTLKKLMKS